MSLLLPFVLALLPAVLLIQYFIMRDAYPEPRGLVWKTVGLGALATIPIAIVGLALESIGEPFFGKTLLYVLVDSFIFTALIEEGGKFLVLSWVAAKYKDFDEPMDGIVYGVAASLGFAALENMLYVGDGGMNVALLRMLTAVPGHAMFGVLMGTYFGIAYGAPAERAKWRRRALIVPILFHGAYDCGLMAVEYLDNPAMVLLAALGSLAVLVAVAVKARRLHVRMGQFQRSGAPQTHAPLVAPPSGPGRLLGLLQTVAGAMCVLSGGGVFAIVVEAFRADPKGEIDAATTVACGVICALFMIFGVYVFRAGVRRQNRADAAAVERVAATLHRVS